MKKDEFIERCANDVAFFAYNILYKQKRELAPKQIALVEAFRKYPHVAAIFNRQGGKTEVLAVYDTHELCFGKAADGTPDHTYIYAPILEQTNLIMGRIHQFFNAEPLLKGFVKKDTKHFIEMKNGNTIKALSASEQSHVRGHSPTKIQIDESQDISDRIYHDDILPSGAATGAKIQETGTPKGRNHFYNLYRMKDEYVVVVTQTWDECPFIDRAYVMRRKARMPRAKFNAEFNCVFLSETNVAFPTAMLEKIIVIDPDTPKQYPGMSEFYLGGDIAKRDETVFVVLGLNPADGKLYMVDMIRKSAFNSYKVVFDAAVDLCDEYNILYGLIDMTGVGEGIVDMLPDSLPLEGQFQTNEEKQDMVDEFMVLGEGEVEEGYDPQIFLWNDWDLRQQFYEWEAKTLKSKKTRYHHPDGGHDDIVMAALSAAKAFKDDSEVTDYGTTKGSVNTGLRGQATVLGDHNALKILNTGTPDDIF